MQTGVVVLCAFLLVWWVVGNQWNRLRMRQLLTTLRPVLRLLAAEPTVRWHGAAACEVQLGELRPEHGLSGGAFLLRLLPRDLPLAWAYRYGRGRRDRLDLVWHIAAAADLSQLQRPDVPALLDWHVDSDQRVLRAGFDLRPAYELVVSDCLLSMAASLSQAGKNGGEVISAARRAPEGGAER